MESFAWDDLRILLALHTQRSFLAAGKQLGVSTSTVARRIDALEAGLGRKIVTRTNAGALIEPDAMSLVRLAEELETGLRGARRTAGEDAIAGTVRISVPDAFARPVTTVLAEIRRRHPELLIDFHTDDRLVDLARREADVALRPVKSASRAVVDRFVGQFQFQLYASPSYLERRLGEPRVIRSEASRHDFIGYDREWEKMPSHQWLVALGAARFVFRTNNDDAIVEAVAQGIGIGALAETQTRGLGLVRLDTEIAGPTSPVYVSFHKDLRKVPRVRLVIDALEAGVRKTLA
ncbi:MAG: LysR family transcriptional regulator [Kofleriaceae bacterium]